MKTQINEIKRMQQLAGIINESQLNENEEEIPYSAEKGLREEGFKDINNDLSNIKKGDFVATKNNGVIAEFIGISSSGKYIIVYEMDGSRSNFSADTLKKYFLVKKR